MIHLTTGNMFETEARFRVNTVNCVGVMGIGVALAFKKRHPDMFDAYRRRCALGLMRPGVVWPWETLLETVINFPTKRHWRDKSRYEDIRSGLCSLRSYLEKFPGKRVTVPALGCGHGGLDWSVVAPMIEEKLADLDNEIFVFQPGDSLRQG